MRIAPTLQKLARAEWNFYGVCGDLIGKDYRIAEDAAWKRADAELRALLAVARAAKLACELWPDDQTTAMHRALARLERVSKVKP